MKLVSVAYLSSYLLSLLGNSIAAIALPLIVLQVTGSVLGAGAVAAATAIPAVLAGLLMGAVIDRINRRASSVLTDLVSAAALAALPVIDMISGLSLGWFILMGIIGSLGDVPGMTARDALLPAIVRHSGITAQRLMGLREALGAVALLAGPAAAGTLMTVFDGSTVLWITAATSLIAALITLLLPRRVGEIDRTGEPHAPGRQSSRAQLRDGWRALLASPFLVATTALSLVSVIVLAALQGLILPVYFTDEEQPGLLGFVLTAIALGTLVGGVTYAVVGNRGRRRTWFLQGLLGTTLGLGIIAALASVQLVFVGAFVLGLASGLFGSLVGVLMIERIPEQMRGRILGTQNSMLTAAAPAGIVAAALLIEFTGLSTAAVAVSSLWLIAVLIGLAAPSLRNLEPVAEQPEDGDRAVVNSA